MKFEKLSNILRNDLIMLCIGMFGVIILCLPYLLLGEDAYITIHDNLDGFIASLKLMKDNQALFAPDNILPIMGGIRRSSLGNEWNLTILPYTILPCYWALVVNILFYKLSAFIGLYLLLRHYLTKNIHPIICLLISFAFACIPASYATVCGISSVGVPLVIYAFLNLQHRKHIFLSYTLIIFYTTYSFLQFSGVFVGLYLLVYGIYLWTREKKFPIYYVVGLVLMGLIYAIANYRLVMPFFVHTTYVSHRSEFILNALLPVSEMIKERWQILLYSQYHAGSFFAGGMILIYLLSMFVKRTKKMWVAGGVWLSLVLLIFIGKYCAYIFADISIFREFQFDRFYFLYPCVNFILGAIAVDNIWQEMSLKYQKRTNYAIAATLCFVMMVGSVTYDKEVKRNWWSLINPNYKAECSYRQFYAADIFDAICDDLNIENRSSVGVASVAMFPAVAEYNGFYCVDGYMSDYPLEYKHQFRNVIVKELEKDEVLKNYFDSWGSRCYVFSAETQRSYMHDKNESVFISHLDLDVRALLDLGCEYLLSSVPINHVGGMRFLGSYDSPHSYWKIYLFKVEI